MDFEQRIMETMRMRAHSFPWPPSAASASGRRIGVPCSILLAMAVTGCAAPEGPDLSAATSSTRSRGPSYALTIAARPTGVTCDLRRPDRTSELCAQWAAADAAAKGVAWAERTFYLGVAGTLLGALTLAAAAAAAFFAGKAAEHGLRGNEIARDVQRPWMKVSARVLRFEPMSDRFRFSVAIRAENIGGMIALDTKLSVNVMAVQPRYFADLDSVFAQWEEDRSAYEPMHVIPGDAREATSKGEILYLPPHLYDSGGRRRLRVAVLVYCTYIIPGENATRHTKHSWLIKVRDEAAAFRAGLPIDDIAGLTAERTELVGAGRYGVS